MTKVNIGKVAITPRGDYNAATTYGNLDQVIYNHDSWISKKPNNTGNTPADNSTWWQRETNGGSFAYEQGVAAQTAAAAALAAKAAVEGTEVGQLATFLKVAAQAIAEQQAEIDALKQMIKEGLGDIIADNLNLNNMPKIVGAPLYSQGAGAPAFVPRFIGQKYFDTTNNTLYVAINVTNSTGDWKSTK